VAVANGTAALHLCALTLGVKAGTRIITTPITFAASANCIRYCEGEVTFADINQQTYLLDIEAVRAILEASPKGTYQGVIPVDFAGRAVNLEELRKLANEYNLWIIEDACHAPGGYFVDSEGVKQTCGNGKFADLAIFSFHPVKHIACGEGGMITTNDEVLYHKLLKLRTHGIVKNENEYRNSVEFAGGEEKQYPGWYMEMQELGFNYRLTDFQAALGISQISRADEGLIKRKQIAKIYEKAFLNKTYILGQSGVVDGHAYHLYIIEVPNRFRLYNYLREANIFAQIHYIPCHLMPYYRNLGWKEGDMPNSEQYYKGCISLPMYPTLTDSEQNFVIQKIEEFFAK
jgi:dTDP-4-amino-4,6-dideoxygalactose transaminase